MDLTIQGPATEAASVSQGIYTYAYNSTVKKKNHKIDDG